MASSVIRTLKVVVVRGIDALDPALARWLQEHCTVLLVDNAAEVAAALAEGDIDLVVTGAELLRGSDGVGRLGESGLWGEDAAHGLGLADARGAFLWSNSGLRAMSEEVRRRVAEFCAEAAEWAHEEGGDRLSHRRGRRHSFDADGRTFEVSITPIRASAGGEVNLAALVWDATRSRTLHEKIDALDKAGAELVSLDAEQVGRLTAHERLDLLEQKLIRYTRELMQFDNFTVHLLDERTNKLELVLCSGMPSVVREIPLYAAAEGSGITGHVAASGRSYICADTEVDSLYIPGREGAKSSLTVPLKMHDKVVGVFNVESRERGAFGEDDRQFAEIFARHLAVALHILNLLITERHATAGQFASEMLGEVTGPLNDILTDVAGLLEDFIGHDELRHRLNQICDNAVRVRDTIRQVAAHRRGVITPAAGGSTVRHDPVLKGRRILVADDEEVLRETVGDVLRSYGCQIEDAADGDEAIALIGQHEFDLVLSDIRMPGRTGYDVFAAAKERNRDCPVILMTGFGYDPNHSIVRARREGLAAVLFKPFKVEQLLGEIRTAIKSITPRH